MKMILILLISLNLSSVLAQDCSDQLEASLDRLPKWLTEKRVESSATVNQKCISEALGIYHSWTVAVAENRRTKNQIVRGQFAYCKNDETLDFIRSKKPICQTQTYLNVLQNSFHDVMDCFDLDPKLFFPLIALESGFHINALSVIGEDIGIGQLTAPAIDDVNSTWDNMFSILITSSAKKSCQRISQVVSTKDLTEDPNHHICTLVSAPKNPIKNLVYMAFLTRKNLDRINNHFSNTQMKKRLSQLTQNEVTDLELNKIAEMLTYLSYNKGYPTAIEAFEKFLNVQIEKIKLINLELEDLIGSKADTYLISMVFKSDNDIKNYNLALKRHSEIVDRINEIRANNLGSKMNTSLFLVSDNKDSFGEYLKTNEISLYLEFLKERAQTIEKRIEASSSECSQPDYLTL